MDEATDRSTSAQQTKGRSSNGGKKTGSGLSGRSKPRASLACINCRQRKIKCVMDTTRKICNSCRALQVSCRISRDGDRRKAGSREQVSALQDRLVQLESIVKQGQLLPRDEFDQLVNGSFSELEPHQRRATEPALSTFDLSGTAQGSSPNGSQAVSASEEDPPTIAPPAPPAPPSPPPPPHPPRGGASRDQSNVPQIETGGITYLPSVLETTAASSTPDRRFSSVPDVFQQELGRLTPRSEKDMARLDMDTNGSQPRFYGPTSQRHLHRGSVSEPDHEIVGTVGPASNSVDIDSGPVRSRLFQTFWNAQPLSQALVDQRMFEEARASGIRSQNYSFFLENIILAEATRMSTSQDIRALGPKYAERASAFIVEELQDPAISTVQGFLLLSDFEATRGRDRVGYMYCGIACRMIFDLGLQENCSDLIAQGKLSPAEALYRHVLFVGAYVYDKLWSLYLGRPSAITDTILGVAQKRTAEQGWIVPPTLDAWAGLATDISEVTNILNSAGPLEWEHVGRLAELDDRISRRCESLPASLTLEEARISDLSANLYGLQIQFRGIRIMLHRHLSQATMKTRPPSRQPRDRGIEHSRAIMHESAIMIARLVSVYQQIFGIENVVTVMLDNMFVAAALLVSHVLGMEQSEPLASTEADVQWIKCLADMLSNAQKHYPVTARMKSTLAVVVQETSLADVFGPCLRRQSEHSQAAASHPNRQPPGQFMIDEMLGGFDDPAFYHDPFSEDYGHLLLEMDDNNNMMSRIFSPAQQ